MHVALRTSLALRQLTILLAGAGAVALAGCGQKGPLTAPVSPTAAAASAPTR